MTTDTRCYLAMDVGGTNVNAGLVNNYGQVLARRHFPTRAFRPPREVLADMAGALKTLIDGQADSSRPLALAMGLPGWIDPAEGVLLQAPNMPGWVNVPVAEIMSLALDMPVRLENDTSLYALGEWLYGAGRNLSNLLIVTLGTGVGGGLILDNKLWNGSFASAGEIGHTPLCLDGGAQCGCGRRGCLETVASATGMSRMGREWLAAGKPTAYCGRPEDLSPRVMFGLAQDGDEMALRVFDEAGRALGLVISTTLNLLGLEGVVIGGGAAGAFEFIEPSLGRAVAERLIITKPESVKILKGALGEDAPLVGAAALLREHYWY